MRNDFFSTVAEIFKYGGSTFAALVATSLYTVTDSYFIGNWVGTDGLGAMAMVFPATMIFTAASFLRLAAVRSSRRKSARGNNALQKTLCARIISARSLSA